MAIRSVTTRTTTTEYDDAGRPVKQLDVIEVVETHVPNPAPTTEGEQADGSR